MLLTRDWDVIIVGAGPAGSVAAHQLAGLGASVLLVERSTMPRSKVCGSCLGPATLRALEGLGLDGITAAAGAQEYRQLRLYSGGRKANLEVVAGVVMSRAAFDLGLLEAAVEAGARAVTGTLAELLPDDEDSAWRRIRLLDGDESTDVRARIVLSCDGLGGGLLRREPGDTVDVAPGSPVGAGAVVAAAQVEGSALGETVQHGTIHMACDSGGYVGLVRLENGDVDLAAALRPELLRRDGSPALAVQSILAQAGLPEVPGITELTWKGTPALTRRRRRLGAHRVLAIGDCAGYVEPFTGDGIAWAIAGARAVAPIAHAGIHSWQPQLLEQWQQRHHALFGKRQQVCRRLGWLLRQPRLTGLMVAALGLVPRISHPVTSLLARPIPSRFPPVAVPQEPQA